MQTEVGSSPVMSSGTAVVLDGGSTADTNGSSSIRVVVPAVESHRRAVAIILIVLLGVLVLVQVIVLAILEWNGKKVENVSNAFHSALPVVSGLAGSAVTYYFTREKS